MEGHAISQKNNDPACSSKNVTDPGYIYLVVINELMTIQNIRYLGATAPIGRRYHHVCAIFQIIRYHRIIQIPHYHDDAANFSVYLLRQQLLQPWNGPYFWIGRFLEISQPTLKMILMIWTKKMQSLLEESLELNAVKL